MRVRAVFTVLTLGSALAVAGCKSDPDSQSTTGPYSTPDYAGTHYNPVVNSTGSGLGSSNPAAAGGGHANTSLPGDAGTADQNAGSGSPSGATGSSAAGGR